MACRPKLPTGEKKPPKFQAPAFYPTDDPEELQRLLGQVFGTIADELAAIRSAIDTPPLTTPVTSVSRGVIMAQAGDVLRLQPGPAGIQVLLPTARSSNKGQDVSIILQHATGSVTVRAVEGLTQGVASVTLQDNGLRVFRSDGGDGTATGAGAWWIVGRNSQDAAGVTPVTTAPVLLGAASPAFPGGLVATDSATVDVNTSTPGIITFNVLHETIGLPAPVAFPVDDDGPWGFPPVPFQLSDVLGAGNHSGPNNSFVDVGQFINFGVDGPTVSNPQIRSGDAIFRIRGGAILTVGGTTGAVFFSSGGNTELAADAGQATISTSTVGRLVITSAGEWTTPTLGALGKVLTHQGPGNPPLWATPAASGAASTPQPPGVAFPVDDDGPPWVAIPGPQGPAGNPGATGAAGVAPPGMAFPVDADEIQIGSLAPVHGWGAVLLSDRRSGGSSPVVDFGQSLFFQGTSAPNALQLTTQVASNNGNISSASDLTIQAANVNLSAVSGAITGTATAAVTFSAGVGSVATLSGLTVALTPGSNSFARVGSGTTNGFLCISQSASSIPSVASTDGMFWVRNDTASLPMYTDSGNVDVPLKQVVVNSTAATVVSAATTILNCTGTYTIPANSLRVGSSFGAYFTFRAVRGVTGTGTTLAMSFDVGAVSINMSPTFNPTASITYNCRVWAEFTVLTTGAGGTAMGQIMTLGTNAAGQSAFGVAFASSDTIVLACNTTIALALAGRCAFSVAVAGTSLTNTGGRIEWLA